jgi:tryptophan-rich sensory protein
MEFFIFFRIISGSLELFRLFDVYMAHTLSWVMKLMKYNWKNIGFWVLITEGVGLLAGLLSRNGTEIYQNSVAQPPLSPPGWLFPVVWGILYAFMGIGASLVSQTNASPERSRGLNLMVAQLVVNFFWPLFFFNLQAFGFSLLWLLFLWGLVLWMILTFRKTSPLAALLQIPYLLWLTFAVYLNAGVWYLNR